MIPSPETKGVTNRPVKSKNYIVPMWQHEDAQHDLRTKHLARKPEDFGPRIRLDNNKRTRESNISAMSSAVRRMSFKARSAGRNQVVMRDRGPKNARSKGVMAPKLHLKDNLDDSDEDDSMDDGERYQPQPRTALRKVVHR